MQSDLRIGDNSYVVYTAVEGMAGMSAPFSLGSAPIIKNNTAYVPIDLFVPLFGNDPATVKTSGDTITINPDAKTEDGVSVELRGNDKVNVATWSNGGFAYSVSAKQGISETEVAAVVSSAF